MQKRTGHFGGSKMSGLNERCKAECQNHCAFIVHKLVYTKCIADGEISTNGLDLPTTVFTTFFYVLLDSIVFCFVFSDITYNLLFLKECAKCFHIPPNVSQNLFMWSTDSQPLCHNISITDKANMCLVLIVQMYVWILFTLFVEPKGRVN